LRSRTRWEEHITEIQTTRIQHTLALLNGPAAAVMRTHCQNCSFALGGLFFSVPHSITTTIYSPHPFKARSIQFFAISPLFLRDTFQRQYLLIGVSTCGNSVFMIHTFIPILKTIKLSLWAPMNAKKTEHETYLHSRIPLEKVGWSLDAVGSVGT